MNLLFNEAPLLTQWFPRLEGSTVLFINRFGQLMLLIVGVRSPFYWLAYPFLQFWRCITIWASLRFQFVSILSTAIKSFLQFLWANVSLVLIVVAMAIEIKTLLTIASFVASRFSRAIYRAMLVTGFLVGAGSILVST